MGRIASHAGWALAGEIQISLLSVHCGSVGVDAAAGSRWRCDFGASFGIGRLEDNPGY